MFQIRAEIEKVRIRDGFSLDFRIFAKQLLDKIGAMDIFSFSDCDPRDSVEGDQR